MQDAPKGAFIVNSKHTFRGGNVSEQTRNLVLAAVAAVPEGTFERVRERGNRRDEPPTASTRFKCGTRGDPQITVVANGVVTMTVPMLLLPDSGTFAFVRDVLERCSDASVKSVLRGRFGEIFDKRRESLATDEGVLVPQLREIVERYRGRPKVPYADLLFLSDCAQRHQGAYQSVFVRTRLPRSRNG